jgi:DNA invertase Pin-like site-specific DNA recombinase
MKAAIYARISNDPTGRAAGVERQMSECRDLAAARGAIVLHELIDNDLSATSGKRRPQFERVLDLIRAGEIDTVVIWHTDRLYRLPRDLEPIIELAESRRLRFLTVTASEIDLNTPSGRMVARMLAAASAQEVEHKAERQRSANLDRAKQGKRTGGRRAFGFEPDGITVREAEAEAVRAGYQAVLSGVPLAAVARSWNQQGFTTGQARQARSGHAGEPSPWAASSVRAVLLNPRYMGRVRYKGEIMPTPAEWPAIVSEETFEATRALLSNPARRTAGRAPTRLLTGIARCAVAGCGATVHSGGNSRRGVAAYRCSGSLGHIARMAGPVDDYVSRIVVARLSRADAATLMHRKDLPDVDQLRADATGLRERLKALAVDFADGELTAGQLRAASERIRERLADVERQLADAGRVDVLGDLIAAENVAAVWESLPIERRRAVVSTLMRVVLHPPGRGTRTFRPETVGIEWLSEAT